MEFTSKIVTLNNNVTVKAQIWDTAGSERYRAMTAAHYRKAVGALVVYDISNVESFINVKKWVEELQCLTDPGLIMMLIGNKVDLVEENSKARKVSKEEAEQFAQENNMLFFETSATTSKNVKESFETLLFEIYKKNWDEMASNYDKSFKILKS